MSPSEFATTDAVAGLAREVDALRRVVDPLREVGGRIDHLARVVAQLADTVTARPGPTAAPSWLMAPADTVTIEKLLGELCAWLRAIYLRYPDGQQSLPECWLWHADVVEELFWLMHAWCTAYQGPAASAALVADWHDRLRPGAARRVRASAGTCSRENHTVRPGWDRGPEAAPELPGAEAVPLIAGWWAAHRDDPPPEPGPMTRKRFR